MRPIPTAPVTVVGIAVCDEPFQPPRAPEPVFYYHVRFLREGDSDHWEPSFERSWHSPFRVVVGERSIRVVVTPKTYFEPPTRDASWAWWRRGEREALSHFAGESMPRHDTFVDRFLCPGWRLEVRGTLRDDGEAIVASDVIEASRLSVGNWPPQG